MDDFIKKFWEIVDEEHWYQDMLTFEEIHKIFDQMRGHF